MLEDLCSKTNFKKKQLWFNSWNGDCFELLVRKATPSTENSIPLKSAVRITYFFKKQARDLDMLIGMVLVI